MKVFKIKGKYKRVRKFPPTDKSPGLPDHEFDEQLDAVVVAPTLEVALAVVSERYDRLEVDTVSDMAKTSTVLVVIEDDLKHLDI
jgi:hypothetical protein